MGETADAFRARKRKLRLVTCKHFAGVQNHCLAKLDPMATRTVPADGGRAVFACIRDSRWGGDCAPECAVYEATSAADVDAEDAAFERHMALHAKGLSDCCEAPINETSVHKCGPYKGHGPRFCSKCHRVVFWV